MDKDRKKKIKLEYKQAAKAMGVYQIRNRVNGKVLIGSSKNLEAIFNREKFQLANGCHRNIELQKDWNLYGPENFIFEVLEVLEQEDELLRDYTQDLQTLEEIWLEKVQPFGEKGYNKQSGNNFR